LCDVEQRARASALLRSNCGWHDKPLGRLGCNPSLQQSRGSAP
jgi:hypothetical protein